MDWSATPKSKVRNNRCAIRGRECVLNKRFNLRKIERNDPCPCGSGKKVKKCDCEIGKSHLDVFNKYLDLANKSFSKKYCLHPEAPNKCKGKIVKAHTIQKRNMLSSIENNNHVYGLKYNMFSSSPLELCLLGINNASTFTGFCSYHDSETFSCIENEKFILSPRSVFLLYYRVLCMELFKKDTMLSFYKKLKELNNEISHPINAAIFSYSDGLYRVREYKKILDKMLLNMEFSKIRYYYIIFDRNPQMVASTVFTPVYDFNGIRHIDLKDFDVPVEVSHFSLLPYDNSKGIAIFSWLDYSEIMEKLCSSLEEVSDFEKGNCIVRFLYEFCENNFTSPLWWNELDISQKDVIKKRINSNISSDPHLKEDGYRFVNWKILELGRELEAP